MTTTSTVAERVASLQRASAGQLPPEVAEAFATVTVLSDPGNQIAGQLGILTAPGEGTRAAQLQLGPDLTQVNADGTTGLPMPTVVIADADGVIRWIDVHPDYSTRTEPGQVLHAMPICLIEQHSDRMVHRIRQHDHHGRTDARNLRQ